MGKFRGTPVLRHAEPEGQGGKVREIRQRGFLLGGGVFFRKGPAKLEYPTDYRQKLCLILGKFPGRAGQALSGLVPQVFAEVPQKLDLCFSFLVRPLWGPANGAKLILRQEMAEGVPGAFDGQLMGSGKQGLVRLDGVPVAFEQVVVPLKQAGNLPVDAQGVPEQGSGLG